MRKKVKLGDVPRGTKVYSVAFGTEYTVLYPGAWRKPADTDAVMLFDAAGDRADWDRPGTIYEVEVPDVTFGSLKPGDRFTHPASGGNITYTKIKKLDKNSSDCISEKWELGIVGDYETVIPVESK